MKTILVQILSIAGDSNRNLPRDPEENFHRWLLSGKVLRVLGFRDSHNSDALGIVVPAVLPLSNLCMVWGLVFGVWGLGFRVWGSGCGV